MQVIRSYPRQAWSANLLIILTADVYWPSPPTSPGSMQTGISWEYGPIRGSCNTAIALRPSVWAAKIWRRSCKRCSCMARFISRCSPRMRNLNVQLTVLGTEFTHQAPCAYDLQGANHRLSVSLHAHVLLPCLSICSVLSLVADLLQHHS